MAFYSAQGALAADRTPSIAKQISDVRNHLVSAVILRGDPRSFSRLPDMMRATHVTGLSVTVIHDGAIEWARGFGVTRTGGPPVTINTLFQGGSISKPLTALEVLHLAQEGKLKLNVDVDEYLKSWKIPGNAFTKQRPVTLRELLSHTAGVTVHGFDGYQAGRPLPTLPQVLNGVPPANSPPIRVDEVPGTAWRYSGGGYVIVEQLLEDVTGTPFQQLMRIDVLEPLGMTHSTFDQPLPRSLRPAIAWPYAFHGGPVTGGPHIYPEQSAAGLWTTPSDLARFALSIHEDLVGRRRGVISAATAQAMLSPVLQRWGMGLQLGGSASRPYFEHSGSTAGYGSGMVVYEDGKDGIVVMGNSDVDESLNNAIIYTVAHDLNWPDFSPQVRDVVALNETSFDRFAGAYRMSGGSVMTFWREGRQVYARQPGRPAGELFPMSRREYTARTVDARVMFQVGTLATRPTVTIYQQPTNRHGTLLPSSLSRALVTKSRIDHVRFDRQVPDPESANKLRRMLIALAEGRPDYSDMEPQIVRATRQYLPDVRSWLLPLGDLQSITFKRVTPEGCDIYSVLFAKGSRQVMIGLSSEEKIEVIGYFPP